MAKDTPIHVPSPEEVAAAFNNNKPVQHCPVHGPEPPAINISGLLMAKHDLDGRWCIPCLLEAAKRNGCNRLRNADDVPESNKP